MTAIANELRPGLGWVGLATVGVLLAGAGLMLALLPFSEDVALVVDDGADELVPGAQSFACASPIVGAFRSEPDLADTGWFAYAPNTEALGDFGQCVEPARWRLGLGVAALAAGSGTAVIARRRIPLAPT